MLGCLGSGGDSGGEGRGEGGGAGGERTEATFHARVGSSLRMLAGQCFSSRDISLPPPCARTESTLPWLSSSGLHETRRAPCAGRAPVSEGTTVETPRSRCWRPPAAVDMADTAKSQSERDPTRRRLVCVPSLSFSGSEARVTPNKAVRLLLSVDNYGLHELCPLVASSPIGRASSEEATRSPVSPAGQAASAECCPLRQAEPAQIGPPWRASVERQ